MPLIIIFLNLIFLNPPIVLFVVEYKNVE